MKIDHVAIWVSNLETIRSFYEQYFQATASEIYHNPSNQFASYFLSFPDSGTRLEIMRKSGVNEPSGHNSLGLAHFSIALGHKDFVNQMTERLRSDGYHIVSEPRITGDGYFESVVKDPEGNLLELTV